MNRIEEIRARCEKATQGPWSIHKQKRVCVPFNVYGAPDGQWDGTEYTEVACRMSEANACFIAHAREDIPCLLGAVEAAEAVKVEANRLHADNAAKDARIAELERERDAASDALREIDNHVRATKEPIPYIIETLKSILPEWRGPEEG